jgi:hypothetical protein
MVASVEGRPTARCPSSADGLDGHSFAMIRCTPHPQTTGRNAVVAISRVVRRLINGACRSFFSGLLAVSSLKGGDEVLRYRRSVPIVAGENGPYDDRRKGLGAVDASGIR